MKMFDLKKKITPKQYLICGLVSILIGVVFLESVTNYFVIIFGLICLGLSSINYGSIKNTLSYKIIGYILLAIVIIMLGITLFAALTTYFEI